MGRRYHPQVIHFALSIHGKSPSAYRELQDSSALILPREFFGTIRNRKLASTERTSKPYDYEKKPLSLLYKDM
jgi:hypothetical protein